MTGDVNEPHSMAWQALGRAHLLQNIVQARRMGLPSQPLMHRDSPRFGHTSDEIYACTNYLVSLPFRRF